MHKQTTIPLPSWLKSSALIGAVLLVFGCSTAEVMEPRYYQLSAAPQAEAFSSAQQSLPARVGLLPVHLADVYQQSGVVSLPQPNRVQIADRYLWAGSLNEQLESVILRGLAESLGDASIQSYPWRQADQPDYQLRIRVEQLAGPLAGPVVMEIRWTLSSLSSAQPSNIQQPSIQQRLRVTEPVAANGPANGQRGQRYAAYIAALDRVIQQLTRQLGQSLRVQLAEAKPEAAN